MDDRNIYIGNHRAKTDFDGVTVAVKDNIDVRGYPTTAGTGAFRDSMPVKDDAVVVATLRRAGVDIVGKTNLDELANGATGINPWFGAVENPTDKERIAGGSSAGSAAAVGFGTADFALGTDTGGSLRIPAALCGVAGFKPSMGYFSTRGVYPTADRMDVVGPMAKTVGGVGDALALMSGRGVPSPPRAIQKIGRIRFEQDETIVDDVVDDFLHNLDIVTVDFDIIEWQTAHEVAYTVISYQCWQNNRELLAASSENIGAGALAVIQDGEKVSSSDYGQALAYANEWAVRISRLFDEYDVLACPTVARVAPKIDEASEIDWESFSRTMQFSLSGHPALSAPLDIPSSHLKAGIQFVGKYGSDASLVAAVETLFRVV